MKRLILLATMLALAVAPPALSQTATDQYREDPPGEPVAATGVIEKPGGTTFQYGTHAMTEEATGVFYALESNQINLDDYTGERVTVFGTISLEAGELEGGPALIDVGRVEPAQADGGPGFQPRTVQTTITEIGDGSTFFIENPDYPERSPSATALMWVPEEAQILRQCETLTPATFGDLEAGQRIELTFSKGSPLGDPPPGQAFTADAPTAIKIVILGCAADTAPSTDPVQTVDPVPGGETPAEETSPGGIGVLPDTGGPVLTVLGIGALLISGGLLARRFNG